ncbi:N1221-domain-containing protein [Xylariaceae sp. FL0016]|nr:N1221-domain-containing protein [Xylariaceae sp. FL0016]
MNSLWPSRAANDGGDGAKVPVDVADTGVADAGLTPTAESSAPPPGRPPLQRNQSQPAPISQPPPPPTNQPPDSLSLAQLRQFVSEFPKAEADAYAFKYTDTGPHAEEIDEWFSYTFWQFVRLNNAQRAYESQWEHDMAAHETELTWDQASQDVRSQFILQALNSLGSNEFVVRSAAVGRLMYLVLGRWADTAGPFLGDKSKSRTFATPTQLAGMKASVQLVAKSGGVAKIWEALRAAIEAQLISEPIRSQGATRQEIADEVENLMTMMYITIQVTLGDSEGMDSVRDDLLALEPDLTTYFLSAAARWRFYESDGDGCTHLPLGPMLLLLWKSILLVFGGIDEIKDTKEALRESVGDDKDKGIITASPLDYHIFRQEISSKYPAYVPPPSKIPLDADNISLLPPLPNHPTRNNGSNGILPAPPGTQSGGASILNQAVHIATPAPSPPPSPAVGGKGGKKQNYQTNQNFPLLYPPLDASSNSAGGKGPAGLQEALVGRKWEGSDVPVSIVEAGKLFSERVRMTRALRQLWEERVKFLKFERGFDNDDDDVDSLNLDLDALDIDSDDNVDEDQLLNLIEKRTNKTQDVDVDAGPNSGVSHETQRRLRAIEDFYKSSLPQLQSLVIVLMKSVLGQVTACIAMPYNGQGQSAQGATNARGHAGPIWNRSLGNSSGINGSSNAEGGEVQSDDVNANARSREIEGKAATGIILLLMKWLKVSHILKFEYLAQLLLDSNYLPLVLKLFAHQDIQQTVESKVDNLEHSFFNFCNHRAQPPDKMLLEPTEIDGPDDESEDEAAPPPIKRRRSPPPQQSLTENGDTSKSPEDQGPARPEVDELGLPVNPLPKEPITDFSRRNFFALINYLRIMQKICKNKAHRNLLLVQYKSSNILRKSLKVPQDELRLYTLKLFKNQVPYCGRKWRQSNMRVITAVYLHCRPELRDEWLAGSDVDAEVEEALPLEQALRSLTHWFNVRRYPDQMAPEIRDELKNQQDFFKRELEKMEIWNEVGQAESAAGDWDQQQPQQMGGLTWG